jgi:hypothetical protein
LASRPTAKYNAVTIFVRDLKGSFSFPFGRWSGDATMAFFFESYLNGNPSNIPRHPD